MATLVAASGFGPGTAAGWAASGTAGNRYADAATNAIIGTTSPRTGSYFLTLGSGASQTANIKFTSSTIGTTGVIVGGVAIRFRSALPSDFVDILTFEGPGGSAGALIFDQPTGKLVMDAGGGTQSFSASAVTFDTWYWIDFKYDCSTTTHTIDWKFAADGVAPVAQSQASASGKTAGDVVSFDLGRLNNETPVVDYADLVLSATGADYPLEPHKVVLVKADTSGTAVEIGTANATARFTSNGSGLDATFNSANILTALSEVPPTIGGSASGVYQRTSGTGNAVGIPMTTYTLQSGESITGVRIVIPGWAASATANNVELRAYEGNAETTLFVRADPNFDNSTTAPPWLCKMFNPSGGWTQTKLDNLVVRFGYSNDVSPQPGAHAIYAEVAVKLANATKQGSANPGLGLAVTATGTATHSGTANPGLSFGVTATDNTQHAGSNTSGGVGLSVTATGRATHSGAATTGGVDLAVTATGSRPGTGTATTGGVGLAVTTTGSRNSNGTATTGGVGLAVTAVSSTPHTGSASFGVGLGVTAVGSAQHAGVASDDGIDLDVTTAGVAPVGGFATLGLGFGGNAFGVRTSLGTANPGLGIGVTAVGATQHSGTANQSLDLGCTAVGSASYRGQANPGISLGISAVGGSPNRGTANPGLGFGVTAVGTRQSNGTASPGLGIGVNAVGSRTSRGSTSFGLDLAITAVSNTPHRGTASCPLSLAVTASGSRASTGQAPIVLALDILAGGVAPSNNNTGAMLMFAP